jgi:hypothetical protein
MPKVLQKNQFILITNYLRFLKIKKNLKYRLKFKKIMKMLKI